MFYYILTSDEKGPLLYGPYSQSIDALQKQGSLSNRGEIHELPTRDRSRAARMLKEQSTGVVNFTYGS